MKKFVFVKEDGSGKILKTWGFPGCNASQALLKARARCMKTPNKYHYCTLQVSGDGLSTSAVIW